MAASSIQLTTIGSRIRVEVEPAALEEATGGVQLRLHDGPLVVPFTPGRPGGSRPHSRGPWRKVVMRDGASHRPDTVRALRRPLRVPPPVCRGRRCTATRGACGRLSRPMWWTSYIEEGRHDDPQAFR